MGYLKILRKVVQMICILNLAKLINHVYTKRRVIQKYSFHHNLQNHLTHRHILQDLSSGIHPHKQFHENKSEGLLCKLMSIPFKLAHKLEDLQRIVAKILQGQQRIIRGLRSIITVLEKEQSRKPEDPLHKSKKKFLGLPCKFGGFHYMKVILINQLFSKFKDFLSKTCTCLKEEKGH